MMKLESKNRFNLTPRCEVCNARGGCSCYPEDSKLHFDRYQFDPAFKRMSDELAGFSLGQLDDENDCDSEICAVKPERNAATPHVTK